jgi:hypothetical protein
MIEFGEIDWTSRETAQDGSGDTRYFGVYAGVRLFVIKGTTISGPDAVRPAREFRAYRLTGNGTERPVGRGGAWRKLFHVKDECEQMLDRLESTGELKGWLGARKERGTLLATLQQVDPGNHAAVSMTLPELRLAVERAREAVAAGQLAPTRTVERYVEGDREFRKGDSVTFAGPVFEPGDRWRIGHIRVPDDGPAYAGLVLVARRGGLPVGTTYTAVRLSLLRSAEPRADAPSATVTAAEALQAVIEALRDEPGAQYTAPEVTVRCVAMRLGIEL